MALGAFVEGGFGNYDTYNSFTNAPVTKGDGDTKYYGVGFLGRFTHLSGFYADASARVGQTETDFKSHDLTLGANHAKYDSKSMYYSAHAGIGYEFTLPQNMMLDTYAKYLWTRTASDTVNILGTDVHFDAANSQRVRAGFRLNIATNKQFHPYVGLAYEYEFDGKAKAQALGYQIDAPDLKGSTGIAELGVRYTPTKNDRLSFNAGVSGHVGNREGVTGSLRMNYRF